MTRPTVPTPEQLAWLEDAVAKKKPYRLMASYMGVCVDTVKRILQRNDLDHFDGAKYSLSIPVKMWTRPCIRCGNTDPRPKNKRYCSAHTPVETGLNSSWDDF